MSDDDPSTAEEHLSLPDGFLTVAISFPQPWPPTQPTSLIRYPIPDTPYLLELWGMQPGNFEIWLLGPRQPKRMLASAPVTVEGQWAVVMIGWGGTSVRLIIELTDIPPLSKANKPIHLRLMEEAKGTGQLSFNAPTVEEVCKRWVNWRKDNLAVLNVPEGRIAKTLTDQVQELQFAMQRLQELSEAIKQGNLYWLGSLAIELRALLHWKDHEYRASRRKKHIQVPLLFRVAQYKNLPLPVFMRYFPQNPTPENLAASFQSVMQPFTVKHEPPNFKLVDLQEWLESPAFYNDKNVPTSTKALIAGYTETMGPGHYDSGIPSVVNALNRSKVYDVSIVANFLFGTAQGVIEVGEHVLEHFTEHLS